MKIKAIFAALAFAVLFAACQNPLSMNGGKFKDAPEAGYGKVSIGFAGQNGRTVFPSTVFENYVYTFTDEEDNSTVLTPDAEGSFVLEAGDWTVTVDAYVPGVNPADAGATPAATGRANFTLNDRDVKTVDVTLEATETTGAGTFTANITYPAEASITRITLEQLPSYTPVDTTAISDGSGTLYDVPAGYYLLTMILAKGNEYAGKIEVVHIYDQLTSAYDTDFVDADFTTPSNEWEEAGYAMGISWIVTYDSLSVIATSVTGDAITMTGNYTDIHDGNASLESGGQGNDAIIAELKTMTQFTFTATGDGHEYRVAFSTPETVAAGYNHFGFNFTATGTPTSVTVNIPGDLSQRGDENGPWWGAVDEFIQANIGGFQFQALDKGPFNLTISDIVITQPVVIPPEPTATTITITGLGGDDGKNARVALLDLEAGNTVNGGATITGATAVFELYQDVDDPEEGTVRVMWNGSGSYIVQLMIEDGTEPVDGSENDFNTLGRIYLYNGGTPFAFDMESPDFDIIPRYTFDGADVDLALDQFQLILDGVIGGSSGDGPSGPIGGETVFALGGNSHRVFEYLPPSPYHVEMWVDANGADSAKLTWYGADVKGGAAFKAEWSDADDYLGRVGYYWNHGGAYTEHQNIYVDYEYTKGGTDGGFSFIGMYGWSRNNVAAPYDLIEYYIVDNCFSDTPPYPYGGSEIGSLYVDGSWYKIYISIRPDGSPSIEGDRSFAQIFSVRQNVRQSGTISVTEHFNKWAELGYALEDLYECKFLVEAGAGTGWLDLSYLTFMQEPVARPVDTPPTGSQEPLGELFGFEWQTNCDPDGSSMSGETIAASEIHVWGEKVGDYAELQGAAGSAMQETIRASNVLRLTIEADADFRVSFPTTDTATTYNHWGQTLSGYSSTVTYTIEFSSLDQPPWGASVPFNPENITGIQISPANLGTFNFTVSDIEFIYEEHDYGFMGEGWIQKGGEEPNKDADGEETQRAFSIEGDNYTAFKNAQYLELNFASPIYGMIQVVWQGMPGWKGWHSQDIANWDNDVGNVAILSTGGNSTLSDYNQKLTIDLSALTDYADMMNQEGGIQLVICYYNGGNNAHDLIFDSARLIP